MPISSIWMGRFQMDEGKWIDVGGFPGGEVESLHVRNRVDGAYSKEWGDGDGEDVVWFDLDSTRDVGMAAPESPSVPFDLEPGHPAIPLNPNIIGVACPPEIVFAVGECIADWLGGLTVFGADNAWHYDRHQKHL